MLHDGACTVNTAHQIHDGLFYKNDKVKQNWACVQRLEELIKIYKILLLLNKDLQELLYFTPYKMQP